MRRANGSVAVLGIVAALALLIGQIGQPAVASAQPGSAQQSRSMATGAAHTVPEPLREVGFDQRLGERLDFDLRLVDHLGDERRLGELFGQRPVLLVPVYYDCPMLCSLVLDGVVRALRPLKFLPGREFDVVAVSFDPREGPELAAEARTRTFERYGRAESEPGWTFLTGEEQTVATLMDAIGFRYRLDPRTDLYAHNGGVVLVTPEGQIAQYYFGVDYSSRDLRLGIIEASEERIGSVVDQILLFCFQYDPSIGKYSAVAINLIRAGCALTVVLLAFFLLRSFLRERAQRLASA